MLNAETIQRNFNLFITGFLSRPQSALYPDIEDGELLLPEEPLITVVIEQPPAAPVSADTSVSTEVSTEVNTADNIAGTQTPDTVNTQTPAPVTPPPAYHPASNQNQTPVQPPPVTQTRDVYLYFSAVDRDGQIRQSRVTRNLPASSTPMMDALNAMLIGPNPNDLNGNLLSFIPQNTRLLSAAVRGSTAYISFSEDFLFNTFGIEGYIAQLRQIIWTATEFQNVNDVQILIEGRVINYLGEGIFIGAPVNRQSFQ